MRYIFCVLIMMLVYGCNNGNLIIGGPISQSATAFEHNGQRIFLMVQTYSEQDIRAYALVSTKEFLPFSVVVSPGEKIATISANNKPLPQLSPNQCGLFVDESGEFVDLGRYAGREELETVIIKWIDK